jgi:HD-GYP domain-containing protein (c-di-GMP phosphodiesterase class II)
METVKNFMSTLMIAVSNCSLYPKEHEALNNLSENAHSILGEILKEQFEIMIIDDELIVNKTPFREAGLHRNNLIRRLKRKGISHIVFLEGVTHSEIKQFIVDISETGKGLKSCPHIKTGSVDVDITGLKPDASDIDGKPYSPSDEIEKVKDIFHSASPFKKLNTTGLEEVVMNFIAAFRKEADILKLLSPIKSFSEYTYVHATNVAILSTFQAESLGIRDELLHEIGVAALLHDVGKMFISKDILDKKGRLDDHEFDEIKKHPLYGARYLAKADNLTRLAPIIAFEHHMKYDRSGYPAQHSNENKQHICSQIVAIADFYDALRSIRPYRGSMDINDIMTLLKKGVDKDFNPFFAHNFITLMETALSKR